MRHAHSGRQCWRRRRAGLCGVCRGPSSLCRAASWLALASVAPTTPIPKPRCRPIHPLLSTRPAPVPPLPAVHPCHLPLPPARLLQRRGWTKKLAKYLPWLKKGTVFNLVSDESQIWQGESPGLPPQRVAHRLGSLCCLKPWHTGGAATKGLSAQLQTDALQRQGCPPPPPLNTCRAQHGVVVARDCE